MPLRLAQYRIAQHRIAPQPNATILRPPKTTMALTAKELAKLRTMCERDGVTATAKALGVHRSSVVSVLAGLPIRPNTEKVIRAALQN